MERTPGNASFAAAIPPTSATREDETAPRAPGRQFALFIALMKRTTCALWFAVVLVSAASYGAPCGERCDGWWPNGNSFSRLDQIGRGIAVVFTPDLAVPGNRVFYERLGFRYFESADWREVLDALERHNLESPDNAIHAVILETHGTNGHGLKLQSSKKAKAPRSYISVGGLREGLSAAGIGVAFISACNAGRLFRPQIYRELTDDVRDPAFLPPTLGIINASSGFDADNSYVQILRRGQSNYESLMHGSTDELNAEARSLFESEGQTRKRLRFAVSTMLIQLLLYDGVELTAEGWVERKSTRDLKRIESERLFRRFLKVVDRIAMAELANGAVASK